VPLTGLQHSYTIKAEPQVRRSARVSRFRKSIEERDIEDREAEHVSPSRSASKVTEGRVVCASIAPLAMLVSLTRSRHYSLHRASTNTRSSTRNVNEKMDILPLKTKTGLLRNDLEPHLQAARPKENHRRKQRGTPAIMTLTRSRLGFRLKGGLANISDKTVQLGKLLNATAG